MLLGIKTLYCVIIVIFCAVIKAKCGKILGVFPMVGGSHFKMSSSLMRGLADAGNDVTIICPREDKYVAKNGSYRSIVLDGFEENYNNDMKSLNLFESPFFNSFTQEAPFQEYMLKKSELILKTPGVQKLINSNETFDAVIIEQFSNDALKVFAYIFKAHLIVFCPIGPYNFVNRLVGNPTMVAYNPQVVTTFKRPMSFMERVYNTLLYTYEEIINHFVFLPMQDRFIKKHFPGAPSVYELVTNVSLVLLNSHESFWQAVPLVPNVVPIGGYHLESHKLPDDIMKFLDDANEGVVYFSMGTNLKVSDMDPVKKKMLINVFGKLKEKILWKSDENITGINGNIRTRQWLPQVDILAHPNVKLFISHGGLLSLMETIHNAVPSLMIPVYGDQATNGNYAEKAGFALSIGYHDVEFTEKNLLAAIEELLRNSTYKENALKQSKIYHDRPMKPIDSANYWINFIIKHQGAPHLRVDGLYLPWYQYLLLDVVLFLFVTFVMLLLFLIFVIKAIFAINKEEKKIKKN